MSHSSKDRQAAARLATDLNFAGVDVWLDQWELHIGQSLTDGIAKAMADSRYIAILITANYNKSAWTKTEYKRALAREQREGRTVMLPLILGETEIPDFLEEKVYVDLRNDYFSGIARITAMVHELSAFRVTRAVTERPPQNMADVWRVLATIGFEPFVVVGRDDFDEILAHGGERVDDNYAYFYPDAVITSAAVSDHTKTLLQELRRNARLEFQLKLADR
jgi:hypothetical protein